MKNNLSRIFLMVLVVTLAALTVIAPATDAQTFKVLHTFTGNFDGGNPQGNLIFDAAGNLYGVTNTGGGVPICPGEGAGCGLVCQRRSTLNRKKRCLPKQWGGASRFPQLSTLN